MTSKMLRAFSLAEVGLVSRDVDRVDVDVMSINDLYAEFVNKYYVHSSATLFITRWHGSARVF